MEKATRRSIPVSKMKGDRKGGEENAKMRRGALAFTNYRSPTPRVTWVRSIRTKGRRWTNFQQLPTGMDFNQKCEIAFREGALLFVFKFLPFDGQWAEFGRLDAATKKRRNYARKFRLKYTRLTVEVRINLSNLLLFSSLASVVRRSNQRWTTQLAFVADNGSALT